jgi:archaellin
MNNWGSSAIYAIMILSSVIVVGAVAANIIDGTSGTSVDQDLAQMTADTIDKYSTYIDIDFKVGKFYKIDGSQKITRIALQMTSLFSTEIDLNQMGVQLLSKDTLQILNYTGIVKKYSSGSLFDDLIWNNITENSYGFLVINDMDDSMIDFDLINENSDRAYLIFKLSDKMALKKYDNLYVSILPGNGITRLIRLKAPMPIKPLVVFE